jgi:hypothetical protein
MHENTRNLKWVVSLAATLALVAVGMLILTGAAVTPMDAGLQQQVDRLGERVNAHDVAIGKLVGDLADKTDRSEWANLVTESIMLSEHVAELRALITAVEGDVQEVDGLVDQHKNILAQIARTTNGRDFVPSIEANMARGGLDQEMRRVVNASIEGSSVVTITNRTGADQQVKVNETGSYRLAPGETSPAIVVPTGNVSTRLPGQDPINWAVGPPRYEQRLQIVNRPGVVTYTYVCPWPYIDSCLENEPASSHLLPRTGLPLARPRSLAMLGSIISFLAMLIGKAGLGAA